MPFRADVQIPLRATEYEVELRVSGATPGVELADTEEVLSYFFGAVNGGAFCLASSSPSESSLEIAEQAKTEDGSLHYRGRVRNVAPGAWRILLSMLAQTHYKLDPLSVVRLVGTGGPGEEAAGVAELLECAYPNRMNAIPFPVEVDDAREHIRIELRVLHVTEVFRQRFAWQRLGLPPASFVPATPPSFDALAFVYPWLLHSLHHIGSFGRSVPWHGLPAPRVETKRRHDGRG